MERAARLPATHAREAGRQLRHLQARARQRQPVAVRAEGEITLPRDHAAGNNDGHGGGHLRVGGLLGDDPLRARAPVPWQ